MNSASEKTYLSGKQMEAYVQKKKLFQKKKESKSEEVIMPKSSLISSSIKKEQDEQIDKIKMMGMKMSKIPEFKEDEEMEGECDEDNRSLCSVNSDELDGELNLSDNEEEAQVFR